jgi:large subunit ribosomal protein L6
MSRVGKTIIKIPAGVKVEQAGNVLSVSGAGCNLKQEIKSPITVEISADEIRVLRGDDESATKSLHGLFNRLIQNMIKGVTTGFSKYLFCNGVGYKASMKSDGGMTLNLGVSHPIDVPAVKGIKFGILTPQEIQTLGFGKELATMILKVQGAFKEEVGAVSAKIRALRPVEPYHLYGIRYSDEYVAKKESKSGAKK